MRRSHHLGLGAAVALLAAALPATAFADASLSRRGNVVTLTSDGDGDHIANAGTDNRRLISFFVESGRVLRAGRGCVRLRGPHVTRVVVTCGAPSQTHVNAVTLRVRLGGGDDEFVAAPWDDVQPRIIADGGAGDDTIYGSTNSDDLDGGPGDDALYGLDDVDDLDGGPGSDMLVGGGGNDSLVGGPGRDRIFGDETRATGGWGNDVLTTVGDGEADQLQCAEGEDAAVLDAIDTTNGTCENLSGGQDNGPHDVVGELPVRIHMGALADTPGGLARILHGEPIRMLVRFSAAAAIGAQLELLPSEVARLHVPERMRVVATGLGTPFTLVPLSINAQIRLAWPVRRYLEDARQVRAKLTITAQDVNGAVTTASRNLTFYRR